MTPINPFANPFNHHSGQHTPAGLVHPLEPATMYATFLNQTLAPDITDRITDDATVWPDIDTCAGAISGLLASATLTEEDHADLRAYISALIVASGMIARLHEADVDLATCLLAQRVAPAARPNGDAAGLSPHASLGSLVGGALVGAEWYAQWAENMGITSQPPTAADLAVALQSHAAARPTDSAGLAVLWVGYAILLAMLGSSMPAATSEFVAQIEQAKQEWRAGDQAAAKAIVDRIATVHVA